MKMSADPLLVAVALGMLNPSVFEVDDDVMGEANPPPMLDRVEPEPEVAASSLDADLSDAVITAEDLVKLG